MNLHGNRRTIPDWMQANLAAWAAIGIHPTMMPCMHCLQFNGNTEATMCFNHWAPYDYRVGFAPCSHPDHCNTAHS